MEKGYLEVEKQRIQLESCCSCGFAGTSRFGSILRTVFSTARWTGHVISGGPLALRNDTEFSLLGVVASVSEEAYKGMSHAKESSAFRVPYSLILTADELEYM